MQTQYRITLPNLVIEGRALSMERGTGMSVMTALAYLRCWDPDAVVAIYPDDHFAEPTGPFAKRVAVAMAKAATRAWQVVVLGSPELEGEVDLASGVVCARVSVLWSLAGIAQPALMEMLDAFVPLVDLEEEDEALALIYAQMPAIDLVRDILARCPDHLVSMSLDEEGEVRVPVQRVARWSASNARAAGSGLATARAAKNK